MKRKSSLLFGALLAVGVAALVRADLDPVAGATVQTRMIVGHVSNAATAHILEGAVVRSEGTSPETITPQFQFGINARY